MGATAIGHRNQRAQRISGKVRRALPSWTANLSARFGHAGRYLDQQGFVVYSAALKSLAVKAVENLERPDPSYLRSRAGLSR